MSQDMLQASRVDVVLGLAAGELMLEVSDDGVGIAPGRLEDAPQE